MQTVFQRGQQLSDGKSSFVADKGKDSRKAISDGSAVGAHEKAEVRTDSVKTAHC